MIYMYFFQEKKDVEYFVLHFLREYNLFLRNLKYFPVRCLFFRTHSLSIT